MRNEKRNWVGQRVTWDGCGLDINNLTRSLWCSQIDYFSGSISNKQYKYVENETLLIGLSKQKNGLVYIAGERFLERFVSLSFWEHFIPILMHGGTKLQLTSASTHISLRERDIRRDKTSVSRQLDSLRRQKEMNCLTCKSRDGLYLYICHTWAHLSNCQSFPVFALPWLYSE